jgi:hypothetical protein
MKKLISLLLLVVSLSGCVGVYFSKNGDVVANKTATDLLVRTTHPPGVADKINPDGSEMYITDHERVWCGLTIVAIIPIPLWLPLCHSHTEVTYKDGKPRSTIKYGPTGSGFLCGPFVPIMGIDGGSQSFCRSI